MLPLRILIVGGGIAGLALLLFALGWLKTIADANARDALLTEAPRIRHLVEALPGARVSGCLRFSSGQGISGAFAGRAPG